MVANFHILTELVPYSLQYVCIRNNEARAHIYGYKYIRNRFC